jgi:hypothetical protein
MAICTIIGVLYLLSVNGDSFSDLQVDDFNICNFIDVEKMIRINIVIYICDRAGYYSKIEVRFWCLGKLRQGSVEISELSRRVYCPSLGMSRLIRCRRGMYGDDP